ncbi:MAG TPA: TrkA C-terminal domain-containing protein, partial [Gemmatimonadota bacterium]|nr:TrkA C-terminal domain-containing protein [Gemmatimonadota bacterium]
AKIPVPPRLVGRSIREARIREETGVSVVAIERVDASGRERRLAPEPETVLKRGDMIVVLGEDAAIERLKSG